MIADKYSTVYVKPFENRIDITDETYAANKYRIYRPFLETDITKAVRDKYLFDGNLRPYAEENSDLLLEGQLIEFARNPLRYDDNDEVSEYRLNLTVDLRLYETREKRLVWEEKGFTGSTTYFTTGSQAKSESAAINEAMSDLARRIVERTVEQW